ncbi:hypothetical protein Lpp78_09366, partial [Lacticaseibacillus paracasei subsp. paracasei CNCM I-2877]
CKKLDRSHYQDLSAVDAALAAVNRNLSITQQAQVDTMAAKITAAIAALVLKPAPQPDPRQQQVPTKTIVNPDRYLPKTAEASGWELMLAGLATILGVISIVFFWRQHRMAV